MRKVLYSILALVAASITACNSDETAETEPINYSGVTVSAFSLQSDDAVLNNLDSVFFSIDLNSAKIYNADSLPCGTDISALAINISTDACSTAQLFVSRPGEDDLMIDYLASPNEKLDFSNGPVRLHLISYDGTNSRDYEITVNVHTMSPDSLSWNKLAAHPLPSAFSTPESQKAVKFSGKAYCLTSQSANYSIATTADPSAYTWEKYQISIPGNKQLDVNSFTATDDALYVLTTDGLLLTSTDGRSWNSTGQTWHSISAAYSKKLLGIESDGTKFRHVTYPATNTSEIAAGFPIEGVSGTADFSTKWSENNQIIIIGGKTTDGKLSGATWAYDGENWACLSNKLPEAEGYSLARFTICETDTNTWRTVKSDVLLATGGRNASGTLGKTVWISRDMGLNWQKGGNAIQLPDYIPAFYRADLLVFEKELNLNPTNKAIRPVTEWECPYLYIFGGITTDGQLQSDYWQGVINYQTFKPLQ